MTTIVYRAGVLAADSLAVSQSNLILSTHEPKIFRNPDGGVAALAGGLAQAHRLRDWVLGPRDKDQPAGDDDPSVIVLWPDGRLEVYESGGNFRETEPFMAWGSGRAAALGALHCGKSAVEAVEIAIKVDVFSGGAVQWMGIMVGEGAEPFGHGVYRP